MIAAATGNPRVYPAPTEAEKRSLPVDNQSSERESLSLIDQLFQTDIQSCREQMNSSPLWNTFKALPDTFLAYIYAEKNRLAMAEESRYVVDDNQQIVAGFHHGYEASDDQYHPGTFRPFMIKGYWIPCSEGKRFQLRQGLCSITRTVESQNQILYLVHPKSTTLFAPLTRKYQHTQVDVPALALSSFRTLLIALPVGSTTEFAMVKVSLNEKIGGVRRLLVQKECAASVAASAVLNNKQTGKFTCLEENLSFVPDARLLDLEEEAVHLSGAGMIHRPVPELFTTEDHYIIPLYALFGINNWPLLNTLIEQSQKTPTLFITDTLLRPIAEEMVDHIYSQRFYLEFHGQNVLLKLDKNDLSVIDFIYRDMGGVNCRLSDVQLKQLPEHLRDHAQYWEPNFISDAAVIMEGIAKKVLFNLTKVFFKSEPYNRDPEFCHWRAKMTVHGYQDNWTLPGADGCTDKHRTRHTPDTFYRYGYYEKIFARELLEVMSRHGIFLNIKRTCPGYDYAFFMDKIGRIDSCDTPCVEFEWFSELVKMTLPHYYQHQDAYSRRKNR
ncbi:IucA/IucC family protein [Endozoicomonas sp. SESOKO1]|uniref:IucA/IucC family protein n=1 Tax=Endozoicomonas sp. SESOKO1 TaxID=2828742 RepID=UPI002148554A|nr:IucA/IucC family protein [Endozoicomonas sp. SESOKO1]